MDSEGKGNGQNGDNATKAKAMRHGELLTAKGQMIVSLIQPGGADKPEGPRQFSAVTKLA
jgi:hypothetical protein